MHMHTRAPKARVPPAAARGWLTALEAKPPGYERVLVASLPAAAMNCTWAGQAGGRVGRRGRGRQMSNAVVRERRHGLGCLHWSMDAAQQGPALPLLPRRAQQKRRRRPRALRAGAKTIRAHPCP